MLKSNTCFVSLFLHFYCVITLCITLCTLYVNTFSARIIIMFAYLGLRVKKNIISADMVKNTLIKKKKSI
jgi:hypothetical protein